MQHVQLYWKAMICDEPTQQPIVGAQVTIKSNGPDLETYTDYSSGPSGWVYLQGVGRTGSGTTIVSVDVNAEAQGFGKTTVQVGTLDANGFHWSINSLESGIENTVWLRSRRGQSSSALVADQTGSGFGALGTMPGAGPATGGGVIYAIQDNGDLLWYRHDGRNDGSFSWAESSGKKVDSGWNFKQVFSGGDGVIYAIEDTALDPRTGQRTGNHLLWYRHDGWRDGSDSWAESKKVGNRWGFKQVFSGGDGVIYAIQDNGDLLWYRHDGRNDGSFSWAENFGKKVGNRWNFKQVFSGGDGVIYAIQSNGDLLWYRHDGRDDGSFSWAESSGKKADSGWNFKQVFSGGDGVIYAIEDTALDPRTGQRTGNHLLWYRHDGWRDGSDSWAESKKVGDRWNFTQVF